MSFVNPETDREFQFWSRQLIDETPPSQFITLQAEDVLNAHFHLLDHFSSEGIVLGGIGPRDVNLLQSTIHRQYAGYAGYDKWNKQFDIIATLFYGLVRNHPFHDANKRTALLCMLFHLEKSGKCMMLSDQEIEDFTVDLADHKLERHRRPTRRVKRLVSADEEVLFVARWLRRNSRNIDNEYRDINYHKLQTILRNFGFDLVNPKGNKIDLIKYEKKIRGIGRIIGRGEEEIVQTRIQTIGFHSWKSTVPKGVMKGVREAAGLTYANGFDSHIFYNTKDPIEYLIGRYETPLRSLADR